MIATIALRELRGLFLSPLAWVVLAGSQFLLAYLFLIHLQDFLLLQPKLRLEPAAPGLSRYLMPRMFAATAGVLLLIAPFLSMRCIAGELRDGSFTLLQSAPVTMHTVVLGKFLALLLVLSLPLLLVCAMLLSLAPFAPLDLGLLAACALGVWLVLWLAAAVGLYCSCWTRQPAAAAVLAFACLMLIWLLGASGGTQGETGPVLRYLGMSTHLQPFLRGLFDSSAALYFGIGTLGCLALAARRLDNMRLL